MQIKRNINTTNFTTMHVRGSAEYYLKADSLDDIKTGIKFAKNHRIPYCIIGNGSKVFFRKSHYEGIIIHNLIDYLIYKKEVLKAGSGVKLPILANFCLEKSIIGFEWTADIPGTVGGAIYMNAGALGATIADNLIEVTTLDLKKNIIKVHPKKNLSFAYRYSPFQDEKRNEFIAEATFKAQKGEREKIIRKTEENKKYRLETQPIGSFTLGSVFKRVKYKGEEVFPGLLLEKAGCKKMRIGDAEVSQKHANFIINRGNASTKDILKLISIMKKSVKNKFCIDLELEIRII